MNGILKWLGTKFSRRSAVVEANEPQSPGLVQSYEQGQDVQMPDIYARDDDITEPYLKVLDQSSTDDNESTRSCESKGVDPYNTSLFE